LIAAKFADCFRSLSMPQASRFRRIQFGASSREGSALVINCCQTEAARPKAAKRNWWPLLVRETRSAQTRKRRRPVRFLDAIDFFGNLSDCLLIGYRTKPVRLYTVFLGDRNLVDSAVSHCWLLEACGRARANHLRPAVLVVGFSARDVHCRNLHFCECLWDALSADHSAYCCLYRDVSLVDHVLCYAFQAWKLLSFLWTAKDFDRDASTLANVGTGWKSLLGVKLDRSGSSTKRSFFRTRARAQFSLLKPASSRSKYCFEKQGSIYSNQMSKVNPSKVRSGRT
jgi:hypothetical protein